MKTFNSDLNRNENQFFVTNNEALKVAGNDPIKLGGIALYGFVVTHTYDPKSNRNENGGHTWNRYIVK